MNLTRLKSKKLVFTVTTGRSGTGLLAEKLKYINSADIYHEAEPGFHNHMRAVIEGKEDAKDFLFDQKLPFIERLSSSIYIETSHLFCKGFLEPLLEIGIIPDLILLRRPERDTAKSLYQLGTIPGRNKKANKFYLMPSDSKLYLPLSSWQDMHDYQLCFWYTLEIIRRQQIYHRLVKVLGGKVVEVTLDDISKGQGIKKITDSIKLPPVPFWSSWRRNKKVNTKTKKKRAFDIPDSDLFDMEREVYNATDFFGVNIY
ncbi:MAG: hypothetical protein AAF632_15050 [Bacteroidota bacterium]